VPARHTTKFGQRILLAGGRVEESRFVGRDAVPGKLQKSAPSYH